MKKITRKKLRIALAGAGNIAQNAHLPVYADRDDVEVVALADLSLPRAQEAAAKFGVKSAFASVQEMVDNTEFDAMDICVWNASHADCAIAAARAGKAILCEKPMALNLEHALRMKAEVDKAGVTFMMAMPSRYTTEAQLLMKMVNQGKLGDIYYAKTSSIRRRGTPLGWFTDTRKSGGGPVIDIGVHCIDRTWFLMGRPKPVRVSAMSSNKIGDYKTQGVDRWIALDSDVTAFDTEDSAAGVIHFENGACMLFEVSWALNAEPLEWTQVCGSKAGATLNPLHIFGEDMNHLTDNELTTIPVNPFAVEIGHFIECLRAGKTPESTLEDGLAVQRMLEGIYKSAQSGKEVAI